MTYLPEGVCSEYLINIIREIGIKVCSLLNTYTQDNYDFQKFSKKLVIKNIKNDIVTEADLKVNEIIKSSIIKNFVNIDWEFLSEEDYKIREIEHFKSDWVWIIDPLDGTRDFVNRSGEYACHIALAYKKKIIMANIIVPSREELWLYLKDKGTWCEDLSKNKIKLQSPKIKKITEIIITKSRSHSHQKLENLLLQLNPKKVIGMGSVGYKITSIIRGQADLYISYSLPGKSSPKDWDMAAPEAILRGYGGFLTDIYCRDLEFLEHNKFNQGGIIVGSLNLNHRDICKKLLDLIKN